MRDELTAQCQKRHTDGAATRPERDGVLVLPGLREGLVLPSLPGALCKGKDPGTWFPHGTSQIAIWKAKEVCAACPACLECLQWALQAGEMDGVWGGTTPTERAEIRRVAPEGLARPELAGRTDRE
jgi:WhiB family transcriptional regulator, redox-sensing transcriptional regulator